MSKSWTPILEGEKAALCRSEIQRIYDYLLSHPSWMEDTSLFKGKAGIAVFLAYYYKDTQNKQALELLYQLIEGILGDMSEKALNFSFVNGVAGIHWALQHINNMMNNELFEADYFNDLSQYIESYMQQKMAAKDYDLLYGGIGAYTSLSESPGFEQRFNHEAFYDKLMSLSTFETCGEYYWIDAHSHTKGNTVNLGLAHGLPSVWQVLSQLYKNGHFPGVPQVIAESYASICRYPMLNNDSLFPNDLFFDAEMKEKQPAIRNASMLSWCYGDLCIAHSLVTCGINTASEALKEAGIQLALRTLERNTLETAGLRDPCLCHGTTSGVHIYNRLYHATGVEAFRQAALHWFDTGLQFRNEACYKLLELEEDDSELEILEQSLLDGYVGIGLVYLSLCSDTAPDWDRALLLS
jgi:lantibiotic biosynthesis protein